MGIIVNKENSNDKITERINADLRAKAANTARMGGDVSDPDFAEGSEYVKNFKKTSRFGWIWVVLVVLAVASILSMVFV